jgi:preprotein translocase subunit SecG
MLQILETPLTVVHVLACVLLMVIILLQPGKSGGISAALGGAGAQQVFGGRGAGTFLTKGTWALATTFFVTSVVLAYSSSSVKDTLEDRTAPVEDTAPAIVPAKPASSAAE